MDGQGALCIANQTQAPRTKIGEQSGEQIHPDETHLSHLRALAPACKSLRRLKRHDRGGFSKPPPSASRPPLRRCGSIVYHGRISAVTASITCIYAASSFTEPNPDQALPRPDRSSDTSEKLRSAEHLVRFL